ncbi:hypothetical protein [Alicyclobacillus dauci]|uniref:Uncharacterized protein n=1 Tax=Alicyclobacillus dauci TaxID=1475485 RepID=A0ABY6Z2S0_9BACL|nr:hypothetical protein [Alicyclobacillus dauci]WAH37170.1 hypothetical protein NZD86_01045 [Alicyclobacillus dauci]
MRDYFAVGSSDDISRIQTDAATLLASLPVYRFYCFRCDEWRDVEALRVVVAGPHCPRCGQEMKPVELERIQLDLFSQRRKSKSRRRSVVMNFLGPVGLFVLFGLMLGSILSITSKEQR